MPTSRFYYKNLLRRAEDGIGDGTKYGTATSATVNQASKTFALAGLSVLTDLGADADDKFNGMILYFPSSGNKYHIVDWTASTDVATVFETPDAYDTDACEIRASLVEALSDESYPVHRLTDGNLHSYWRGATVNQAQTIRICMPNQIEDGGFERQSAGNLASPWTAQSTQWQVTATSPLLGSRMAVYTQSAADCYLRQDLVASMLRGRTYRIGFKAQAITASPSGGSISIKIRQRLSPNKVIQNGMDWRPAITTSAAWFTTTFVPDFSSDRLEIHIDALGSSGSWGSCTGIRIDEICVYEDLEIDRMVVAGHNWNNAEITSVYGCNCWPGRTNFSYANDATSNLCANQDVDQTEILIKDFGVLTCRPVWEVTLTATSGLTYEAAILFVGKVLEFSKQMDAPFDPEAEEVAGVMNETMAGRRAFHKDFHRGGPYALTFTNVGSAFYSELREWWEEVGRSKTPFFFCFDETNAPEMIRLVRCDSDWLFPYDPVFRQGTIMLTEEI